MSLIFLVPLSYSQRKKPLWSLKESVLWSLRNRKKGKILNILVDYSAELAHKTMKLPKWLLMQISEVTLVYQLPHTQSLHSKSTLIFYSTWFYISHSWAFLKDLSQLPWNPNSLVWYSSSSTVWTQMNSLLYLLQFVVLSFFYEDTAFSVMIQMAKENELVPFWAGRKEWRHVKMTKRFQFLIYLRFSRTEPTFTKD